MEINVRMSLEMVCSCGFNKCKFKKPIGVTVVSSVLFYIIKMAGMTVSSI